MEFQLRIKLDNAAFDTGDNQELSRILRKLADKIEHITPEDVDGDLFDVNGNLVGFYYAN